MEAPNRIQPPSWADNLLQWLIAPHLLEEVQGDLYEVFYKRCGSMGVRKAKWLFILDVLRSLTFRKLHNPFLWRQSWTSILASYMMSGWRNFLRYRSYSLINIFGLSMGFASALLLFLIIRYENSFDQFHSKSEQIYRVGNSFKEGGFDDMIVTPQLPLMKTEYPDIVHASRFHGAEDIMGHGETYVRSSYHIVDADFARMFDFPVIQGDLLKALSSPNQIVLTESRARSLFGNDPPMGKTVRLVSEKTDFTVSAVLKDPPKNSSLQFNALIPWDNAPQWLDINEAGNWYNTLMVGYVELAPEAAKSALEEKLETFKNAHFLEERRATWGVILLPLANEHSRLTQNEGMITILSIIAIAIMLISCINFANLTIAQSLKRIREIGVRRILGSLRQQVILQFTIEGFITCAVAMFVGVAIAWVVIPGINQYYDLGITLDYRQHQPLIAFLVAILILPGLSASIGLSFALAHIKPANAVKGVVRSGLPGAYLRHILVVTQFAASIILLIGTAIIWQQTSYMKSQDPRFNRANVATLEVWPDLFRSPEKAQRELLSFRDAIAKETAIESVSFASGVPGEYDENYNIFSAADAPTEKNVSLRKVYVNHNFFETFGMHLTEGRFFNRDIESDKQSVIINATAMKAFGWTDIADKEIIEGGDGQRLKVIGVVEDYHYQSLQRTIQPLVHYYVDGHLGRMAVRLKPGRIEDGLALLRDKWATLDAFEAFNYRFVDDTFDNLYKAQDRLTATCSLFSMIAVVISALGLFTITAYSIRLRRKEVSIRKVMGASVTELVIKLSKSYGVMVLIGFLVACPIAYHIGNTFLSEFAHRIEPSPLLFAGAGIAVFALACFIVGCISARAAFENPVNALKEE